MKKTDLQHLLSKYKAGTISDEELSTLENWYLQWKPDSQPIEEDELEHIKQDVWNSMAMATRNHKSSSVWYRVVAAAAILLFLSLTAVYFLHTRSEKQKQEPTEKLSANNLKPGSNKAILTLSNGAQIVLTDAKNGKLADEENVAVNKTADGKIVYRASKSSSNSLVFNTMATPRGGQYHLTLSDGTNVWLNAASSIKYPVTFAKNERRVEVTGEAYFEVAHNKNCPFMVTTGNQEIKVLGTHFNIKNYKDDQAISTTLLMGSVLVSNLSSGKNQLLSPGEQANIAAGQGEIRVTKVNTDEVISWKNGYFLFDNKDIASIMKVMSRWYNIDVTYKNINRNERFGGTFSRSSNLGEILNNLELLGKVHFKLDKKNIVVTE